jgi:uncharacterized beta-barrel protein YwiB (DUF1934 family)
MDGINKNTLNAVLNELIDDDNKEEEKRVGTNGRIDHKNYYSFIHYPHSQSSQRH